MTCRRRSTLARMGAQRMPRLEGIPSVDQATIVSLGREAFMLVFQVAGPVLIVTLVVGLLISVLEAATQVHEVSLTFVPKMIAVAAVLVAVGPWMMSKMVRFAAELLSGLATFAR